MQYGLGKFYDVPIMEAPPDVVDKYRDYDLLDVARELGQYWLADLKKSMRMIPEEELTPVTEVTPEMYQKGMEIALAPEAGILGGVKGAKALGKFKRTMFHGSPISGLKELKEGTGGEFQRVAGIYLTKSKDEALKYTKVAGKKNAQNIYEVEVNFKNPARRDVLDEIGYMKNGKIISGTEMRDELIKRGYDSVIDDSMNEIIAFKPEQVKIIKSSQSPLKQAILDIHRGANPEKVWKETGWTKDPSGKWMFRIDDSGMTLKYPNREFVKKPLGELSDHPEAFKAYPELKEIPTSISIHPNNKNEGHYGYGIIDITASSPEEALKALKHEMAHAIQEFEDFAPGGSPVSIDTVGELEKLAHERLLSNPKYSEAYKDLGNTKRAIESYTEKQKSALPANRVLIGKKLTKLNAFAEKNRNIVQSLLRKEADKIGTGHDIYLKHAGEIFAREEAAGFKGFPGTMEGIPRDQWIIKKGKGTNFKVIPK